MGLDQQLLQPEEDGKQPDKDLPLMSIYNNLLVYWWSYGTLLVIWFLKMAAISLKSPNLALSLSD